MSLRWISQLDRRILLTRSAALLFGVSAFLSLATIVFQRTIWDFRKLSPLEQEVVSWSVVPLVLGTVLLLVGMWLFWIKCDRSSKRVRTIWFLALLLGFSYGAVPYYLFVYIPTFRAKLRDGDAPIRVDEPPPIARRRALIGPFGWFLIAEWGLFVVATGAMFTIPKKLSHLLGPGNLYLLLWLLMVFLIISTPIYAIVLLFRVGMKRSASSPPPASPDLKPRS